MPLMAWCCEFLPSLFRARSWGSYEALYDCVTLCKTDSELKAAVQHREFNVVPCGDLEGCGARAEGRGWGRKELDTTEWWRTHSTLLFSSTQVPISESLLPQWLWAARETPQTNHLPERRCKNLFPGLSPGISHKINASVGIRSSESDWGFWYFPKLRSNRRCWDNKFQGCRFSPSDNAWISCCLGHAPGNRQHLLPGTPISEIRCQVNPGPAQSISG